MTGRQCKSRSNGFVGHGFYLSPSDNHRLRIGKAVLHLTL